MGTIRTVLRIPLIIFVALFVADLAAYSFEVRPLPTEQVWDYVGEPVVAFYRWIGECFAFVYRHTMEFLRNLFSHVFDAAFNSVSIVVRVCFPFYDILRGFLVRLRQYGEELIAQGIRPFWWINTPTGAVFAVFANAALFGALGYRWLWA